MVITTSNHDNMSYLKGTVFGLYVLVIEYGARIQNQKANIMCHIP